jgi:hypothetical protein
MRLAYRVKDIRRSFEEQTANLDRNERHMGEATPGRGVKGTARHFCAQWRNAFGMALWCIQGKDKLGHSKRILA